MNEWILSSPQFQFFVVLFSTPFALIVAQFGMIPSRDVQILRESLKTYFRKNHAEIPPGHKDKVAHVGDVTRGAAVFKCVLRFIVILAVDVFLHRRPYLFISDRQGCAWGLRSCPRPLQSRNRLTTLFYSKLGVELDLRG